MSKPSLYLRVFGNAALSSCISVGIVLIIVLLLDWRLGHLPWLLATLGLEAAITYRLRFDSTLRDEAAWIWDVSNWGTKIWAIISGIFLAGFWFVTIGIAVSLTVADSMIGQIVVPMIVIVLERWLTGTLRSKSATWLSIVLTVAAYCLCLGAAVIFLWGVENDQSHIGDAIKKWWLLMPALLTAIPFCLLVIGEKVATNKKVATTQFRVIESLVLSAGSLVLAICGATSWFQSVLTLGHATPPITPPPHGGVFVFLIMLGAGAALGFANTQAMFFFDEIRKNTKTGGAVLLDALDSYTTVLVGLVLYAMGYRINQTQIHRSPVEFNSLFNSLFNPSNYNGSSSIIYWILGVGLIFCALVLVSEAWYDA